MSKIVNGYNQCHKKIKGGRALKTYKQEIIEYLNSVIEEERVEQSKEEELFALYDEEESKNLLSGLIEDL